MKEGIHPNYVDSVIRCACGNEVKTQVKIPRELKLIDKTVNNRG